jgi:hypothetical protein
VPTIVVRFRRGLIPSELFLDAVRRPGCLVAAQLGTSSPAWMLYEIKLEAEGVRSAPVAAEHPRNPQPPLHVPEDG